MSRTLNTVRNLNVAVIGQISGLLANLISRKIFIYALSVEYLGISGLFTNILSILALSELGVGTAITYSLYKPLAENDKEKIKSLMHLFKRLYTYIGLFILICGVALVPFLGFFINEAPDIQESISVIYVLYVLNSAVSYFFIYKRTLIIANQQRYIATLYRYGMNVVMNVVQCVALVLTKNFYLYLIILIANTVAENLLVSRKADKSFPYLKEKNIQPLSKEDTKTIKNNVLALMCHRLGGVVVNGTGNIVLSKLVGILAVGIYSNYTLVVNALNSMMGLVFQSITASFGNMSVMSDDAKKEGLFDVINFMTFWFVGFCSISLAVMFNPFIKLWLGEKYLFSIVIVFIIVINFFLKGMRQPVLMARDAMGLFWYDRYKPIAEAIINVTVAIWLGRIYGVAGVLLGNTISTVSTNIIIEPFVLYKYGFNSKLRNYMKKYLVYFIEVVINFAITFTVCNYISSDSIVGFALKAISCVILTNLIFFAFNFKNKNLSKVFDIVISLVKRKVKK